MKNAMLSAALACSMLVGSTVPVNAATTKYHTRHAKRKTVKRVGVGAAAGALVGAAAGGGTGAAVGAVAGGGAGAAYDHHKKKHGQ
jgi:uncharacterized membrane protein YfcA